jgi:hypothetical protein
MLRCPHCIILESAVPHRAKQLWELINDEDAVKAERDRAGKNRNKYGGIDSHGFSMHTGPHVAKFDNAQASGSSAAAHESGSKVSTEESQARFDELNLSTSEVTDFAPDGRSKQAQPPEKPKLSQIKVRGNAPVVSLMPAYCNLHNLR